MDQYQHGLGFLSRIRDKLDKNKFGKFVIREDFSHITGSIEFSLIELAN